MFGFRSGEPRTEVCGWEFCRLLASREDAKTRRKTHKVSRQWPVVRQAADGSTPVLTTAGRPADASAAERCPRVPAAVSLARAFQREHCRPKPTLGARRGVARHNTIKAAHDLRTAGLRSSGLHPVPASESDCRRLAFEPVGPVAAPRASDCPDLPRRNLAVCVELPEPPVLVRVPSAQQAGMHHRCRCLQPPAWLRLGRQQVPLRLLQAEPLQGPAQEQTLSRAGPDQGP